VSFPGRSAGEAPEIGGFKLGFWFGQQGSIYTFVVLIFIYVFLMNRLDAEYRVGSDGGGE